MEELAEDPKDRVVVIRAEHLGHKPATRREHIRRELKSVQRQFVLIVSILNPRGADIGRAVMEHHINARLLPANPLELALDGAPALLRRDVLLQRDAPLEGLDGRAVDADARRVLGHVLPRHLHPRTRRRAQVEHALGGAQEGVLLLELQQLEGGSRAVASLLGEVVEAVETLLGDLVLLRHRRRRGNRRTPASTTKLDWQTVEGGCKSLEDVERTFS